MAQQKEVIVNLDNINTISQHNVGDDVVLVIFFGKEDFIRVDKITMEQMKMAIGVTIKRGDSIEPRI